MQYSPKLKEAMEEVKAILKKHDIAAFVVLHDPRGYTEFLNHITPSYSCVKHHPMGFRIRARLEEDFNGDKAKMEYHLNATSNMLNSISTVASTNILNIMDVSKILDEKIGAIHTDHGTSGHNQQNN